MRSLDTPRRLEAVRNPVRTTPNGRWSIVVGLTVGIVAAWWTPWSLAWLMYPAVALLVVAGVVLWIGGEA